MLAGHDITKSFGETEVLRGIDITVEPGKITVLIGPSGGGKSTLIRALSLLDPPTKGAVSIDDTIYRFPLGMDEQIQPPWPRVSVVFQQLFLWPHLTLRRNITLPLENNGRVNGNGYLDELIELFGMGSFIDRYPNETSLGQQQRTALVRSLVLKPSYILLDEITSALDVEHVNAILSHLQALSNAGTGILIITHLLGFARRAGDTIAFLDDGRILEMGGTELLDSPQHKRIQRFLAVIAAAT